MNWLLVVLLFAMQTGETAPPPLLFAQEEVDMADPVLVEPVEPNVPIVEEAPAVEDATHSTATRGVEAAVAYRDLPDEFTLVSAATQLVTVLFTLLIGPLVLVAAVLTTILICNAGQEGSLRLR